MATTTIDELNVVITANKEEMTKALNQLQKEVNGLERTTSKASNGMGNSFKKLATMIAGAGIGKAIQKSLSIGMEAIETASLFTTTLGSEMAEQVNEWSTSVAGALGLSNTELQRNIGVMYNIAAAMGVTSDNSIKMAEGVTMLAQDMASFYNMSSSDAFSKLQSALVGNTRALQDIGIKIDENTIKQTAYNKGIAKQGEELTNEQLILARYEAILERTSAAQGDLGRTIESPANQTRVFKNNIQELWLAISRFLIPVYQVLIKVVNQVMTAITASINAFANLLGLSSTNTIESGVESSVQGISTGLDDANDNAKKLKNTLAGFDEMNVLQEQDSTTSSSKGGASGYNLSDYELDLSSLGQTSSAIGDLIQEKLGVVFETIMNIVNFVKDNWSTISSILAGVATALIVWKGYFSGLNLISRIGGIIQKVQALWALILANPIAAVVALIAGLVVAFVTAYKTNDEFREKVNSTFQAIKDVITNVIDKIKSKFEDLKSKVVNVAGKIREAFGSTGELFQGFKEGLENVFKKVVNSLIKGINSVLSWPLQKINTMLNKIRSTEILGFTPFKSLWAYNPISIPTIPQLERGGILKKGQIGLLEGNGSEAVVPLERTEWIDKLAEKINSNGDQPIQVVVKIGESTIVDKIIDGINEKGYRTGKAVFNL